MSTSPTLPILLDAVGLAEALGVPVRTLWALTRRGAIPGALRVGGRLRYRVDVIERWLAAGCPDPEPPAPAVRPDGSPTRDPAFSSALADLVDRADDLIRSVGDGWRTVDDPDASAPAVQEAGAEVIQAALKLADAGDRVRAAVAAAGPSPN